MENMSARSYTGHGTYPAKLKQNRLSTRFGCLGGSKGSVSEGPLLADDLFAFSMEEVRLTHVKDEIDLFVLA